MKMSKKPQKSAKFDGNVNIFVENAQKSGFLGRKVLVYQQFRDDFTPKPPFEAIILADFGARWLVKYRISNGSWIQIRLLKGVCSSKPIDNSVDKSTFPKESEKPKVQLERRKLKTRPT